MKCQILLSSDHVFVITKGLVSSQFTTLIRSLPPPPPFFLALIKTPFIRFALSSALSDFHSLWSKAGESLFIEQKILRFFGILVFSSYVCLDRGVTAPATMSCWELMDAPPKTPNPIISFFTSFFLYLGTDYVNKFKRPHNNPMHHRQHPCKERRALSPPVLFLSRGAMGVITTNTNSGVGQAEGGWSLLAASRGLPGHGPHWGWTLPLRCGC